MKRAFLIVFFFSCTTLVAQTTNSQYVGKPLTAEPSKLSIGLNIGANFSTVHSEDNDTLFSENFNTKPGGHFGVKLDYKITDIAHLQTGLYYDIKGFQERSTLNGVSVTTRVHTFYLSVPFVFQFNFKPQESWALFARSGFFYGTAVQGYTRTKSNTSSGLPPAAMDRDLRFGNTPNDDQKRNELGYILGGGFKFESFEIGIGYEQSFSSIAPINDNGLRATNNVIKVSFTYFP